MATKQAEKPEVYALSRVFIKASGITVWQVRSERSDTTYHVTWLGDHVSSCERQDGTPCPGWHYNRKCRHAELVRVREDERKSEQEARNFSACRVCGHLKYGVIAEYFCDQCQARQQEADRRQHAPLNHTNKPFSLMR